MKHSVSLLLIAALALICLSPEPAWSSATFTKAKGQQQPKPAAGSTSKPKAAKESEKELPATAGKVISVVARETSSVGRLPNETCATLENPDSPKPDPENPDWTEFPYRNPNWKNARGELQAAVVADLKAPTEQGGFGFDDQKVAQLKQDGSIENLVRSAEPLEHGQCDCQQIFYYPCKVTHKFRYYPDAIFAPKPKGLAKNQASKSKLAAAAPPKSAPASPQLGARAPASQATTKSQAASSTSANAATSAKIAEKKEVLEWYPELLARCYTVAPGNPGAGSTMCYINSKEVGIADMFANDSAFLQRIRPFCSPRPLGTAMVGYQLNRIYACGYGGYFDALNSGSPAADSKAQAAIREFPGRKMFKCARGALRCTTPG